MHSAGVMCGQHTCSNSSSKIKRGIFIAAYVFLVSSSGDGSADYSNCFGAIKLAAAAQLTITDSMLHKMVASFPEF